MSNKISWNVLLKFICEITQYLEYSKQLGMLCTMYTEYQYWREKKPVIEAQLSKIYLKDKALVSLLNVYTHFGVLLSFVESEYSFSSSLFYCFVVA